MFFPDERVDIRGMTVACRKPTIILVMATTIEATPFVTSLDLAKVDDSPCPLYRNDEMLLVVSGVGKANAAIATTYCCATFHPSLILNLGAAGATSFTCGLGSIFHITTVYEPDRPRFPSSSPYLHRPSVLAGFGEATLATQDRPVIDKADRQQVSVLADLVDMEAAAVLQAARRFHVGCLVFKFVSDTPEDVDTSTAVANMKSYGVTFCRFLGEEVLPLLKTRTLS
jgi:adenosylhomocysteine nucleosidase